MMCFDACSLQAVSTLGRLDIWMCGPPLLDALLAWPSRLLRCSARFHDDVHPDANSLRQLLISWTFEYLVALMLVPILVIAGTLLDRHLVPCSLASMVQGRLHEWTFCRRFNVRPLAGCFCLLACCSLGLACLLLRYLVASCSAANWMFSHFNAADRSDARSLLDAADPRMLARSSSF